MYLSINAGLGEKLVSPQTGSLLERENTITQCLRRGGTSPHNTVAAKPEPDGYNTETMDGLVKFQASRGYNLLTGPHLKAQIQLARRRTLITQLYNGQSQLFYQRFLKITVY
jgi:hypothetical protein